MSLSGSSHSGNKANINSKQVKIDEDHHKINKKE
jgi:hypothetical protein